MKKRRLAQGKLLDKEEKKQGSVEEAGDPGALATIAADMRTLRPLISYVIPRWGQRIYKEKDRPESRTEQRHTDTHTRSDILG